MKTKNQRGWRPYGKEMIYIFEGGKPFGKWVIYKCGGI